MKKYFILLSLLLMLSISFAQVLDIYFFYGETCPHCSKVKPLLDEMEQKYRENIVIHKYEVYNNEENKILFKEFLNKYNQSSFGVPALFIGDQYLIGSKQIPDNLENIIIENTNSNNSKETIVPDEDQIILNEVKESDDSMLRFWGVIQNPFVLLIITIVLVIVAYELYILTNSEKFKKHKTKPEKAKTSKRKRKTRL